MAFQQVKDVITQLRHCHRCLREWLEQSRSRNDDPATARLIEALRQDEHHLQIALTRIKSDGNESVLNTWLQYPPNDLLTDALEQVRFDKDMSIADVVARKQQFDHAMLGAYRQLAASSSAPRMQELFEQLLSYTESRVQNQSWSIRDPELSERDRS